MAPNPPTGLSPNQDARLPTKGAKVKVTLAWQPVPSAIRYQVRVDDLTTPGLRDPRNDCSQNLHFLCLNDVSTTGVSFMARAGHSYNWWVHAVGAGGTSAAATARFRIGEPPVNKAFTQGTLLVYLTAPQYRELIRPTPPTWSAQVVLSRSSAQADKSFVVRSRVLDGRDSAVATAGELSMPPGTGRGTVTIAVPPLGAGRYRLVVTLHQLPSLPGTETEREEIELDVLDVEPAVRIDEERRIRRHGVPWFPLGFYIANPWEEEDFARMAGWGATAVLSYGFGALGYGTGNEQPALDLARSYLDRAHRHGMGVIWSLASFYQDAAHFPNPDQRTGLELAVEYMRNFRQHEAMLAWYTADEPNYEGRIERTPKLLAMQQLIADYDADHPAWLVLLNGSVAVNDFHYNAADFLAVDSYPVPLYPLTHVETSARVSEQSARGARPHWMVAQIHQLSVYEQYDISLREPTAGEKLCMAMLALIAGSRGLLLYSYFDQFREVVHDGTTYVRQPSSSATLARRFQEIAAMTAHIRSVIPALLSGRPRALTPAAATEIRHLALELGGELWVLLANPTAGALTMSFALPAGGWASAEAPHGGISVRLLDSLRIEVTVPAANGGVLHVERSGCRGSRWKAVAGSAKDIAVGPDGVAWILGSASVAGGFEVQRFNGSAFQTVSGTGGVRIAAGPTGAWVVRRDNTIRRLEGSQWKTLPGTARDIAVGPGGEAWIVGTTAATGGFEVRRWTGSSWQTVGGGGVAVGVGPDGTPWLVDADNRILRHNGVRWDVLPGTAKDIAIGADGTAWTIATETSGGGYRIQRWNGVGWQAVDGGAVWIGVEPDGLPWVVNNAGGIYRRLR